MKPTLQRHTELSQHYNDDKVITLSSSYTRLCKVSFWKVPFIRFHVMFGSILCEIGNIGWPKAGCERSERYLREDTLFQNRTKVTPTESKNVTTHRNPLWAKHMPSIGVRLQSWGYFRGVTCSIRGIVTFVNSHQDGTINHSQFS